MDKKIKENKAVPQMEEKNMPEIQEIVQYLQEMKFKKKMIGGLSEGDVLSHMEKVTQMYDKIIDGLVRKNKEKEKLLQKRRVKLDEVVKLKEAAEGAGAEEKEDKNGTLERVLEQLENARSEVIRKAQAEASQILRQAKLRASEEEGRLLRLRSQREELEKEYKIKVYETREAISSVQEAISKYHEDFQDMLDSLVVEDEEKNYIIDLTAERERGHRMLLND